MKWKSTILGILVSFSVLAQEDVNGAAVPTLGEWGMVLFVGLLTLCALVFMRRRGAVH